MSDFIVRFQGVDLSKEHAHKVQAAIQKTVVAELSTSSLAAYAPNADSGETPGLLTYYPLKWRGIIIILEDEFRDNPEVLDAKLTVKAAEAV